MMVPLAGGGRAALATIRCSSGGWLSGDAARYDTAQRARYDTLQATSAPSVGLPPLLVQPTTLFYSDISTNSTLWGNQAYALFFGKEAVWVQPPDTTP